MRPDVETIVTDVHNLQSEVSGEEDKNVQKISLTCFCKQEITSLSEKLEIIFDKVTNDIDECNHVIEEKNDLDKELAKIDKFFAKTKWYITWVINMLIIVNVNDDGVYGLQSAVDHNQCGVQ